MTDLTVQQAKVEQAIQPQADALALFAALAALAAVVVAGQLLSRQLLAGAAEYPGLSALGMDRGQLFVLGLARAGLVTAAGAVIAAAAAVAASPLMPIGPARLAEPDPGVQVNVAVLGLGLLVVALVPLLVVAPVAWHTAGTARARGDPQPDRGASSRLAAALTWLGGVPSAAIGIRMAVEPGRGRGAVPVRSALAGTALAVAAVVAAAVFGASLTQLVDTPRLYGQDWDLGLSAGYGAVPVAGSGSLLAATPGAAYAGANFGPVTVDGQPVAAVGIQPLRGQVFLTLLAGRAPARRDEIVLGSRTLRQLGKRLGDVVAVQAAPGARPIPMRIVGDAIFPAFGVGILTPTGLGDGAAVYAPLLPADNLGGCARPGACYDFYLIRFRPGTPAAAEAAVGRRFVTLLTAGGCPAGTCQALTAAQPAAISNYSRVRATPLVLGALLALLAVALVAQALLITARRRRRDFAIVKALGFLRRQVAAAVAWQASTLAAAALAVGLPLGVAGGRWAWAWFASSVGAAPGAAVPVTAVALAIPVTLLLANLVAAVPGAAAARTRPAVTLRTE